MVNTAAKDLRKNYSKKICEKLVLLMKTTIRALAAHFKASLKALSAEYKCQRKV